MPRVGAQLHHLDERPDPSPVSLRDGLAHAREKLRVRDAFLDNGDFRACHWWDCQTGLRLPHRAFRELVRESREVALLGYEPLFLIRIPSGAQRLD